MMQVPGTRTALSVGGFCTEAESRSPAGGSASEGGVRPAIEVHCLPATAL